MSREANREVSLTSMLGLDFLFMDAAETVSSIENTLPTSDYSLDGRFVNEWGKSMKLTNSSVLTFHPAGAFSCTKEAQRSVAEEQV